MSAACVLTILARTIVWYRRVYRPMCATLERRRGGDEVVRLLPYKREVAGGGGGGGGGVMALYRSVLFVHRDAGDALEREGEVEEGGEGGEGGEVDQGRVLVSLEPTGGIGGAAREEGGERRGREEKVYRKTLYRLSSKEEEVQGWRHVVEECRVSAEDGGRRRREEASGEVSRKRYSVILREEREEAGAGREELDWVVGGWEVRNGGGWKEEGPRSSWGEWLAHYLPSMPWGVTTPPESEAAL
ncbi:hypothetical protein EYF80_025544 [Liparis tanakae]|uniref:Uncharacterized protein n=1 Tax=Liparis tanakae TaxID=230148 RepID=A0A4Z2HH66_9TELE|nr:hypothetical protein EYF80_025544 [Liparis tanakae]